MPYGRSTLATSSAFPTRVSADGSPRYKFGGVTLSLATIPAASGSAVTLPDGSVIAANNQYLRYGQILTRIATGTSQTLTGTDTSGAFTLSVTRPDTGQVVTTGSIAFDATAATVLAALQAVMGPGQAASASGGALGTAAVTIVFDGYIPILVVNRGTLAGGAMTPAVTVVGASSGKYGPYDPDATDGRQTMTRGEIFILDQTFLVTPGGTQLPAANEIIGGVFDGGAAFIDRIKHSGTVTHTLALGPTKAEILTAFPELQLVSLNK